MIAGWLRRAPKQGYRYSVVPELLTSTFVITPCIYLKVPLGWEGWSPRQSWRLRFGWLCFAFWIERSYWHDGINQSLFD